VRKSKPGLSGSMSRNAIISPHFGQRGLLITFTNTAYPPNRQLHLGRALRKSSVLKVTDVWKSAGRLRTNHERVFWKIKFAQCCPLQNSIVCQKFRDHTVIFGRPYLCDPNLQSLLLLLRRSLARRLLRLLRANPRKRHDHRVERAQRCQERRRGESIGSRQRCFRGRYHGCSEKW
jgi:hypothetical protein